MGLCIQSVWVPFQSVKYVSPHVLDNHRSHCLPLLCQASNCFRDLNLVCLLCGRRSFLRSNASKGCQQKVAAH